MKPDVTRIRIQMVHTFSLNHTWRALDEFPRPWLDAAAGEIADWLLVLAGSIHRRHCGLFWASDLDSIAADQAFELSRREDEGRFISPSAFRSTLPSIDPAALALQLGITGPVMTFSIDADPFVAEQSARRWLLAGRLTAAIVIDEFAAKPEMPGAEDRHPSSEHTRAIRCQLMVSEPVDSSDSAASR
ncbi:MAG: hypothetical protein ACP5O1_07420 [Phycisphaerae bacterium]